ncbi:MAG: hypothetical protein FD129_275, partial [bacterium]
MTNQNEDDDDHTAAAVAAGMVAGAAISNSGDKDSQPAATTTPAPAGSVPVGAAAVGGAAVGASAAGAMAYPATPGERSLLVISKGDATMPLLSDADSKAALDRLAADLKASPEIQVLVLVHGAGTDAAASLKYTEDQAGMIH